MVIISTGSQGEPLSALRRMAYRDHPQVKLHDGDTVVFSATPIPGNERAVNDTIDRLYHIGCEVITTARRADPRLRARLRRGDQADAEPHQAALRDAVPRRLQADPAARRARRGRRASTPRTIFCAENGDVLELDARGARFGTPEHAGMIFVDGVDIGDVADAALRDRRMLSADGIFIVVATISEQDGGSVADPEVIFRGVAVPRRGRPARRRDQGHRRGLAGARRRRGRPRRRTSQQLLHDHLGGADLERLKRRPMVLPVVVEV